MKKGFLIFIFLFTLLYVKEGYDFFMRTSTDIRYSVQASLSDIAETVSLIPLQHPEGGLIRTITQVKRDRNDLFILSDKQLFHFDCTGQCLGKLSFFNPQSSLAAQIIDYAIDPVEKQIIAVDREGVIFYADYSGKVLFTTSFPNNPAERFPNRIAYYDDSIWTVSERLVPETDQRFRVEQWLYRFDRKFKEFECTKLNIAEVGRTAINHALDPTIAVAEQSVYVHAPTCQPEKLVEDTLHLIQKNRLNISGEYTSILPVRIGQRFLIASNKPYTGSRNYIFCYDRLNAHAYHLQDGLNDNFYNMGKIAHLQPIDVFGDNYFYCKHKKELQPTQKEPTEEDRLLLFLVKIKTA